MEDKNAGFTGTGVNETYAREGVVHSKATKVNHALSVYPVESRERIDGPSINAVNDGAAILAGAISNIADQAREGWRKETTARLAMKASAEQGTNIAINSIALEKKRNPIMAAVLGQTVTSQVSEAQSIENATTALYNHANENMSKLAELTTDEAIEQLTNKSEDLITEIQDPELRTLALNNLVAQMPKLAQAHYKERYALQRNKQVENNREHIVNNMTALKFDLNRASTIQEKLDITDTYRQNIFNNNDPLGVQQDELSKQEYRSLVLSQVSKDLENGDIMMYHVLQGIGADSPNKLNQTELDALGGSIKAYDTRQDTMATQVMSIADMSLNSAETYEEYQVAVQEANKLLAEWKMKGSNSALDTKNGFKRKAELERKIRQSAGAWAKNQVAVERKAELFDVFGKEPTEQGWLLGSMTKAEVQEASNQQLDIMIARTTGMPLEQANETAKTVFKEGLAYKDAKGKERFMSPVTFAQNYTRFTVTEGRPAPDYVNEFVGSTLQGMSVGQGEKGLTYTEEQREGFRTVEALIEGNSSIDLSEDERAHYQMIRHGFNSGEPPQSVNDRYAQWKANKGKVDQSGVSRKDRNSNVRSIVESVLGDGVSDRVMSGIQQDYDRIHQSTDFDKKTSEAILRGQLQSSYTVVRGMRVNNGKELDKQLGPNGLNTILEQASRIKTAMPFGQSASVMTPVLMAMFGTTTDSDQTILEDANRVNMTGIEYIPGDDSVEFKVVNGSVTRIPITELKRMGELLQVEQTRLDSIKAMEKSVNKALGHRAAGIALPMVGTPAIIASEFYSKIGKSKTVKDIKDATIENTQAAIETLKSWWSD